MVFLLSAIENVERASVSPINVEC